MLQSFYLVWSDTGITALHSTNDLQEHPGGPKIILKYAVSPYRLEAGGQGLTILQGKDATEEYDPIHPPDTLDKYLDKSKHLGEVDMGTVKQEEKEFDPDEEARQDRIARMPILEQCYNLMDFESVARQVMKKTAWAYYSSGADDEIVGSLRQYQSLQVLIAPDNARKSFGIPQDLVST